MSRDWEHELDLVRKEIKNASNETTYAESMDRGAALVREWIRANGFDRAMRRPFDEQAFRDDRSTDR